MIPPEYCVVVEAVILQVAVFPAYSVESEREATDVTSTILCFVALGSLSLYNGKFVSYPLAYFT